MITGQADAFQSRLFPRGLKTEGEAEIINTLLRSCLLPARSCRNPKGRLTLKRIVYGIEAAIQTGVIH